MTPVPQANRTKFTPMRTAFTLIELLLVVAIIAALVGLLLPALSAARLHAGTVRGLANLDQIGGAAFSYAEDFDQRLPIGYLVMPAEADRNTNWATLLNGHLTGQGMTDARSDPAAFLEIFQDPNARLDGGWVHYSAHPVLLPDLTRDDAGQIIRPIKKPYPMVRLKRTDSVVMVMDGCQDALTGSNARATAWQLDDGRIWDQWLYQAGDADNLVPIDPGPDRDDTSGIGQIRWRQFDGAANLLYADGHAVTARPNVIRRQNIRVD